MKSRWAIFISGSGSNLHAALELLPFLDIRMVVSSKASAYGLKRARRFGVEQFILDKKPNWENLDRELLARRVNRIFLLGFFKILPADFCLKWEGRIFNLHPSLLPDFKGAHAIEESFAAGKKMGVTIHEVTAELDAGRTLYQKRVTNSAKEDFAHFQGATEAISRAEQKLVQKAMIKMNAYPLHCEGRTWI